jgi:hypothetical protein
VRATNNKINKAAPTIQTQGDAYQFSFPSVILSDDELVVVEVDVLSCAQVIVCTQQRSKKVINVLQVTTHVPCFMLMVLV